THLVGGVAPGKGGRLHEGLPVFNTVIAAVKETEPNAAMILVPAPFAADSILECIDARVPLVACITEGIPVLDMVKVKRVLDGSLARLIGPNSPGLISPGQCKIGVMPGHIHRPGRVGIISRSGTLTYEAVNQLTARDIGQSTCIGIGGDPIVGTSFIDALELFQEDPDTDAVVMIGEIGGTAESEAASWIQKHMTKPVIGFVAGASAPRHKRMGHVGAIITGEDDTVEAKMQAMASCGVVVVRSPAEIGQAVEQRLRSNNG
ncbi:MAG: succinate--CoA ligase subunit alpha, partial [Hyphomicrobiales bacterium]